MVRFGTTFRAALLAAAGLAGLVAGCKPDKAEPQVTSPYTESLTIAVAPVLNFSGDFTLDPVKAADLLASELSDVQGIVVLPVNRVMAVLAMQNKVQIESPAHALAVAEAVGADAILVPGITEYDPYVPVVGLVLQMYTVPRRPLAPLDARVLSRQLAPVAIAEMTDPLRPTSQTQVVYNGTHEQVAKSVRYYAKSRDEDPNPLGWKQYLKVQSLYLRFCWHDAVERLMEAERAGQAVMADGRSMEVTP
ncbi:MAG TPA: hypothetical protein VMV94_01130 [Phycisphaerae bacterium]|nr:hypothetical protein [Phycisphaerae bacterium]